MKLFSGVFRTTFLFIFLAELLSLFGYLVSDFNPICFIIISILVLFLTVTKLEYGLAILFAELFIGSKGYLFFYTFGDTAISIRIAIWLIVMSVWLVKIIMSLFGKYNYSLIPLFKNDFFKYFFVLFIFIAWGVVNGFMENNSFSDIFFDFNGWLYFALILPIFTVILNRSHGEENLTSMILQVFSASVIWLSLETIFLLFVFSHNIAAISEGLYKWIRITGAGEITRMDAGFYRIFFQSHIYILIAFFVFSLLMIKKYQEKKQKEFFVYYILTILFCSVILIGLSRSNWIGLAVGVLLCAFVLIYLYNWKKTFIASMIVLSTAIYSVGFMIAIVKFPYPAVNGNFDVSSVLSERASQISGEAGASSRWSLLPELWQEISERPMLGKGFGSTVTYKTNDPRILEQSADGKYTTYAFEWGWLDIWLKISIFGAISYLLLLMGIILKSTQEIQDIYSTKKITELGLLIGLVSIAAVSFFSPYLNHPLGIGYLILVCAITLNNTHRESSENSLQKK